MQIKLLTLSLFASFFATGFTAATGPGSATEDIAPIFGDLTKEQSAFIKPIVDSMNIKTPNAAVSKCLFDTVSSLSNAPVDGQPVPPQIVDKFYSTKLPDFIQCVYPTPQ
ncbi:hypothetical protein RMCBS344292_12819 [Rhizopus microsporus]|nr:hypothetical protein RMCBS344292_12819 [Rhizopus microsporus]